MITSTAVCEEKRTDYWSRDAAQEDSLTDPWSSYDLLDLPRPKTFSTPFSTVLQKAKQLCLFVDIDSDILGGTPRISGTRIPVHMILNAVEEYGSIEGAAKAYRSLTEQDIRDALKFAIHVLEPPLEYEFAPTDR